MKAKQKIGIINKLINIKTVIDGFIVDENDKPIAIYELKGGINSMTASGQALDNAIRGFKNAFNVLKPGEEVQIIVSTEKYNPQGLINNYNALIDKSHIIEEYKNFYPEYLEAYIKSFTRDNRILDFNFYVLFTYNPPDIVIKSLFQTKKKEVNKDIVTLKREVSLRSKSFVGSLKQLGLEVIDLDKQSIIRVIDKALNPTQNNSISENKLNNSVHTIKSMLARTPVAETHNKIMLGSEYVKTIYISEVPEQAGLIQELFFRGNLFNLTIYAKGISQQDIKSSMKKKLKLAISTGTNAADVENREIAQSTNELLSAQARGDIKFIKFACYLSFKHEDPDKLEEITPEFESVFQDTSLFEGLFEQKNLWASTLPLCKNSAGHYFLTLTGNAGRIATGNLSNLFPFFNFEVDNTEGGVLLGTSATGQPATYNPWSKKLMNGNHCILGQPGSGKSFYVNLVLNRLSPWKPEVIIIDKSKSYEFLCACNKGQYIKIGLGGENAYNVFDCIDHDKSLAEDNDINASGEPTAAKIAFITGLFDVILAEEGERRLNKLDSSLVEKIIKQTYKDKLKVTEGKVEPESVPTLSDSVKTIEKMSKDKENDNFKNDLLKIKEKLGPFVGSGTYSALLDQKSNIELKSHFIVFDISNLPDREDIQSLAVYIISSFAMQRFKINKKLNKKQILCVDEAWYLARFSGGRSFLLELAKRSRHLGLMVIIATQQIGDFLQQVEAAQVLKSSPTITIFRQSPTDLEHLRELFSLNEREAQILSMLHQERGRYSQAFYISGDIKNTIYVRPDAALRWIATSEPTYDVPARNKELELTAGNPWRAVINLIDKGI